MKIINQPRIILKDFAELNEKIIQDYIFKNPNVLGLGDLQPIIKEKIQPSGGRLDMLFGDENNNRYEVELQLGYTDPNHIIRTIEYWDIERKRYPQYNHTAVLIAEDITSRFQNVISLFNNQIPLIALQLVANKTADGNIALSFIKVMDKIRLGTEIEEYEESTDRLYWEKKSNKIMITLMDEIFEELGEKNNGYELKYNKHYVGLAKDGLVKNFILLVPKKAFVNFRIRSNEDPNVKEQLEQAGLDIEYVPNDSRYDLKLRNIDELKNNKEYIVKLINNGKKMMGID